MNRNNLISKIASRINNTIDGDTVLLLEQHLTPAINTVCKKLVQSRSPYARHLLFDPEVVEDTEQKLGYEFVDLSAMDFVFEMDELHRIALLDTELEELQKVHQAKSFVSMRMAEAHNVPYYKLEGMSLYLSIPSTAERTGGILISHYKYPSITDFPDELEEFLIAELLPLLGLEAQKSEKQVIRAEGNRPSQR